MLILLLYLLFVLGPIIFWFSFFLWEDRADPGPKKLMFFIFILGIGMALLAGVLNSFTSYIFMPDKINGLGDFLKRDNLDPMIIILLVIGSMTEETLKYLTLREFFYEKVQFNQIADGVFYGVTLALGFCLVENTSYFFAIYKGFAYNTFLLGITIRAVFSVLLHITTAGILGFYLGKRKYSLGHSRKYLFRSLGIAYTLHILFNVVWPIGLILLIPSFVWLVIQMKKPEVLAVWKLVDVNKNSGTIYPN